MSLRKQKTITMSYRNMENFKKLAWLVHIQQTKMRNLG